jgi:hypothetical protein
MLHNAATPNQATENLPFREVKLRFIDRSEVNQRAPGRDSYAQSSGRRHFRLVLSPEASGVGWGDVSPFDFCFPAFRNLFSPIPYKRVLPLVDNRSFVMWASILSRLNGSDERKVERIDHEVVEHLLAAGIKDRCVWNYRERDGANRVELRRLAGTTAIYSVSAELFPSMRDDQILADVIAKIALNRSADRTHP